MRMRFHPKALTLFIVLTSGALLSLPSWGQVAPPYTEPIPLNTGINTEPNADNIIFFSHPAVGDSNTNFQDDPTTLFYSDGLQAEALDLLAAPGFLPLFDVDLEMMLADPAGLCLESLLPNLICPKANLVNFNQQSWQLSVADLRNRLPGDAVIPGQASEVQGVVFDGRPKAEPYDQFGLGSLVAKFDSGPNQGKISPPAIAFDVAQGDDWIASPVFGKIFVRHTDSMEVTQGFIEFQSPIIIHRLMEEDNRYHLAGYLGNPSPHDCMMYGGGPPFDCPLDNVSFPVSIVAGNFVDLPQAPNLMDMAVMGLATQTNRRCYQLKTLAQEVGYGSLPWGLNCTFGLTWARVNPTWLTPRDTFKPHHLLWGAPRILDMTVGYDNQRPVIIAASDEKAPNGKFYLLKYYDERVPPVATNASIPFVVFPHFIEVNPPGGDSNWGPFKVASLDINGDGYADAALSWKNIEDSLVNTENRIWKGTYSPFVSVFISRRQANQTLYDQFDFSLDAEDQLAAVAFGQYQDRSYLIVGNQKRAEDGHAYGYFFPISGGLVDNLNVRTVKLSFKADDVATPGVAAIAPQGNGSGVVASLLREPFLPAKETCDVPGKGVYGYLWFGEVERGGLSWRNNLDFDRDGIPNRCDCLEQGLPNKTNDPDFDERINHPLCDTCPNDFDFDHELDGNTLVGDGVADACDNCPPQRCKTYYDFENTGFGFKNNDCINPDQLDSDGDNVGDSCDGCPNTPGLTFRGPYFYNAEDFVGEGFCHHCVAGYFKPETNEYEQVLFEPGDGTCNTPTAVSCPTWDVSIDYDHDCIVDIRDNCVYVPNPRPSNYVDPGYDGPTGQEDTDGDGSGDVCDCPWGGEGNPGVGDDCDGDQVPNRFDHEPFNPLVSFHQPQLPDSVYDPYAGYIADRSELKLAQMTKAWEGIDPSKVLQDSLKDFAGFQPQQPPPQALSQVCGYPDKSYPGFIPCGNMGKPGKEVTVILPSVSKVTAPPPCQKGEDPECTPPPDPPPPAGEPSAGRNVAQYCISSVGRRDPKSAAIFDWERSQIINANNKAQAITRIKDFDIFVGAEGGIIHWECAFLAGACPSLAKATNILPNISGNVAPYFIVQTEGLPPTSFKFKPTLEQAIEPPKALLLAPLAADPTAAGALSLALSPSLSQALPGRQLQQLDTKWVQVGTSGQNINGKMVIKVLHNESDFVAEGTSLAVSDCSSLIAIDYKAPPEISTSLPVELRRDQPELLLKALEGKVAQWQQMDLDITPEIYQEGLPWERAMVVKLLVRQDTIPEAVEEINKSLSPEQALPDDYHHQIVLSAFVTPPHFGISGGCGCRVQTESFSAAGLLSLLCLIAPVPALMYYRRRIKR